MATMSARYTVIDREVVSQERSGTRHQLVPNPLGSVIALYDNSGTKTDTFEYWPYGENANRTGTTKIFFQYVGKFGYFKAGDYSYIRNRYYYSRLSRWITEDYNQSNEINDNLYMYVLNSPILYVDYDGRQVFHDGHIKPGLPPNKNGQWPSVERPPVPHRRELVLAFCIHNFGCIRRAERMALKGSQRYFSDYPNGGGSGAINGPEDAMRHCLWGCYTQKNCGSAEYLASVEGHEAAQIWVADPSGGAGSIGSPDTQMDLHNDRIGSSCAYGIGKFKSCLSCCAAHLRNNDLWILPPGAWLPGRRPL